MWWFVQTARMGGFRDGVFGMGFSGLGFRGMDSFGCAELALRCAVQLGGLVVGCDLWGGLFRLRGSFGCIALRCSVGRSSLLVV